MKPLHFQRARPVLRAKDFVNHVWQKGYCAYPANRLYSEPKGSRYGCLCFLSGSCTTKAVTRIHGYPFCKRHAKIVRRVLEKQDENHE